MASPETTTGPRILIVKLSSLGDLFHALPAVHHLKTGLNAEIHWAANADYTDVVRCFSDVDRVLSFPRHALRAEGAGFLRVLRAAAYDYVIDLQGLLKSGVVTGLARGRRKIGLAAHREGAGLFYHETAGRNDRRRHAVDEIMDVVDHLGLERQAVEFPVRFPAAELQAPIPRIALVPCSRWPAKNWPAANFVEVARALRERGPATFYLLGVSKDAPVCAEIEKGIGEGAVNLCGKTSLLEAGGILQEMDLALTVDSGPMHIAAAVGTPVLAIFGATDPARTGPYGPMHRVLMADALKDHAKLARAYKKPEVAGQWQVPPAGVIEAAQEMLGKTG